MMIPPQLLTALVILALIWTAIAAVILGILFFNDWKQGKIW